MTTKARIRYAQPLVSTGATLTFYAIKEPLRFRDQKYYKHETRFLFLICNHPFK